MLKISANIASYIIAQPHPTSPNILSFTLHSYLQVYYYQLACITCVLHHTNNTVSHLARIDELAVQESSLRLKEQLLQQEKTLLKSQNNWLSSELQSKSEQVLTLTKEKVTSRAELEAKLAQKQEEVSLIVLLMKIHFFCTCCIEYSFSRDGSFLFTCVR